MAKRESLDQVSVELFVQLAHLIGRFEDEYMSLHPDDVFLWGWLSSINAISRHAIEVIAESKPGSAAYDLGKFVDKS